MLTSMARIMNFNETNSPPAAHCWKKVSNNYGVESK